MFIITKESRQLTLKITGGFVENISKIFSNISDEMPENIPTDLDINLEIYGVTKVDLLSGNIPVKVTCSFKTLV